MLDVFSISLKGVPKNNESSFDLNQLHNSILIDEDGSWELKLFSYKFEEIDTDDEDEEEEAFENFYKHRDQVKLSIAEWLAGQEPALFKSYETQLWLEESGEGYQFGDMFPSDLNLTLGMKDVSLIYQYQDLEEMDHSDMNGKMSISLRAYKQGSKIVHEDFLGQLELKDPFIDSIWKSQESGRSARIQFQSLEEFSDQKFVEIFSKTAVWLNQQKDQVFLDLKGKGFNLDVFIGGLLKSDRFNLVFPPDFLLACGKRGLDINLLMND